MCIHMYIYTHINIIYIYIYVRIMYIYIYIYNVYYANPMSAATGSRSVLQASELFSTEERVCVLLLCLLSLILLSLL